MDGCIEVAKAILPSVKMVLTFSTEGPDTVYRFEEGRWNAWDARNDNVLG
jgi:hypothetical protein